MPKKRRKRGPMTLAEHDAFLKEEGLYEKMQEIHRRKAEEQAPRIAAERRAAQPLIEELREAGFELETIWDLVNTSTPYPRALPILLDHLQRPYPDRVLEGIARALAVKDAKFGWEIFTRLFASPEAGDHAKMGLACAISATATDEVIHDVVALVRDRQNGPNRVLLLDALARSKQPEAMATLVEMSDDPELEKEIEVLLERIRKRKRKPGSKLH